MKFKPTHTGLMYGFIPVLLDMEDRECPSVDGRYYGCDLLLSIVEPIYGLVAFVATVINPNFEPVFAIKITSEINKD